MNCTTCRYELSQCLDGRLASGRRAVVMQHAEACAACATFWAELQAAQRLTLQLQPSRISAGFREELWERIRSGEGTPEAVFREQVPTLTKLRYALTGAAVAAGVLLGASLLRPERTAPKDASGLIASPGTAGLQPRSVDTRQDYRLAGGSTAEAGGSSSPSATAGGTAEMVAFTDNPLFASAQRLTFGLVAVETAKQLEQRYAAATNALQRLDANPEHGEVALRQAWENADEFQAFGEVLLDMRHRQRLSFRDNDVDADLRFAVNILRQGRTGQRDGRTVHTVVGAALRSDRLASLSRTMLLAPSLDPREDMDVLVDLNTQRPEVFRELFFVVANPAASHDELGLLQNGTMFLMTDDCGPSWVAPRSEVAAREMLRVLQHRMQTERVKVQFEIGSR